MVAHAASVDATAGTAHTSPGLTLPTSATVLSRWVAKSSDVVSWSLPTGLIVRTSAAGTGGGRLTSVSADPGSPQPAGPVAGWTATSAPSVTRTVMFTAAIGPD